MGTKISKLQYDSTRGQCVIMLLAALREIGTMVSKREAIGHIIEHRYFQVLDEDLEPYPSTLNREPRWQVLIAWARKDCVERGWMFDHDENDSWQITRDGVYRCSDSIQNFQNNTWNVRRCYVWTAGLKKRFVPTYTESPEDRSRPRTLYRDIERQMFIDLDLRGF